MTELSTNDPPRQRGYYIIKEMFRQAICLFYNDLEVVGTCNFPRDGPVIVALNHSNSLTDGMVAMTACPRNVRWTCKDTLLSDKIYGWILRGVDTVGVRRRMDYGGAAQDNTHLYDQLFAELGKGCCVGLFPEGLGRYQPNLSPFKPGIAQMAARFVLNQHQSSHTNAKYKHLNIVPIGVTYLHRDMFRTSVSVRIGTPILISIDKLAELGVSPPPNTTNEEISDASATITSQLQSAIEKLTINAPSWHMITIAHLARQVAFPASSSPRHGGHLAHYIDLTRQFTHLFIQYCSSPADSIASYVATEDDNSVMIEAYQKLEAYWQVLHHLGLKDNRVIEIAAQQQSNRSLLRFKANVFFRMAMRTIFATILYVIATPGVTCLLPIIGMWRIIKRHHIRIGVEAHYDGVAQAKIIVAYFGTPLLGIVYSIVLYFLFRSKVKSFLFLIAFPFMVWTAIRCSEDGTSNARSVLSLYKMFTLKRKICTQLVRYRSEVYQNVKKIVDRFGIAIDPKLVDENDALRSGLKSHRLDYFALRRLFHRPKSDWNETLRFYDVPMDRFHLSKMRSSNSDADMSQTRAFDSGFDKND